MRNRVAGHDARMWMTRVVTVTVLVPVALAVGAVQVAGADPAVAGDLTAARFSMSVAGPVGIIAVLLGAGGLVVGLLRRRVGPSRPAAPVLLDQPAAAVSGVPVKAGHGERLG